MTELAREVKRGAQFECTISVRLVSGQTVIASEVQRSGKRAAHQSGLGFRSSRARGGAGAGIVSRKGAGWFQEEIRHHPVPAGATTLASA